MPGVQKAALQRARRREDLRVASALFARQSSSVVMERPSIFASGVWQLTCALPSSNTVQQPHWPDGEQPSFADRTPSSSRNAARRWG
jgi:hypothetical protein